MTVIGLIADNPNNNMHCKLTPTVTVTIASIAVWKIETVKLGKYATYCINPTSVTHCVS